MQATERFPLGVEVAHGSRLWRAVRGIYGFSVLWSEMPCSFAIRWGWTPNTARRRRAPRRVLGTASWQALHVFEPLRGNPRHPLLMKACQPLDNQRPAFGVVAPLRLAVREIPQMDLVERR